MIREWSLTHQALHEFSYKADLVYSRFLWTVWIQNAGSPPASAVIPPILALPWGVSHCQCHSSFWLKEAFWQKHSGMYSCLILVYSCDGVHSVMQCFCEQLDGAIISSVKHRSLALLIIALKKSYSRKCFMNWSFKVLNHHGCSCDTRSNEKVDVEGCWPTCNFAVFPGILENMLLHPGKTQYITTKVLVNTTTRTGSCQLCWYISNPELAHREELVQWN